MNNCVKYVYTYNTALFRSLTWLNLHWETKRLWNSVAKILFASQLRNVTFSIVLAKY
jgi:hypothetical protein